MALCNLKRRAADGTLDSIPKRVPKGATSRNITPPTDPVVSIPRALPTKLRSWTDDASMLKCFHSFMTSAAPPLKKLLVNTIHFTPTVQTRGQGLHDGAFVLQYSLCETAAGGWWLFHAVVRATTCGTTLGRSISLQHLKSPRLSAPARTGMQCACVQLSMGSCSPHTGIASVRIFGPACSSSRGGVMISQC